MNCLGKDETIHSWAYQDALDAALSQSEQPHLNQYDKDMNRRANFKTLEKVFQELEQTSAKWMIRSNDKKPAETVTYHTPQ